MELNYFKDLLFDVLNESDELNLTDIRAEDRAKKFFVTVSDGTNFEIQVQKINQSTVISQ